MKQYETPSAPAGFACAGDLSAVVGLFDALPGACFYAKDRSSRFIAGNPAQLALLGVDAPDDMLGKGDHDFFAADLADQYVAEDARVFRGERILNRRWMVPDRAGRTRWYLSSKLPLRGADGAVVGLCGLLRDLGRGEEELRSYAGLAGALRLIDDRRGVGLGVGDLAGRLGLSVSQFERRFKAAAGMSPGAYMLRVRIHAAQRLLAGTRRPVAEIAAELGFCDQSFFTRQFAKVTGTTPARFRRTGG